MQEPPTGPTPPYGQQRPYGAQPPQPPYGARPAWDGRSVGFETLEWGGPRPPKRRSRLVPLIAAVAMLLAGGGGALAYSRVGGGNQPADVLPGSAIGYLRIDLKPSAGQRIAAVRYLSRFPSVRERLGLRGDDDDLRRRLFDLLAKEYDDLADVDFATDVEPWLGDRIGVATLPGDDEPDTVIAVQVTDREKADTGLDTLFAEMDQEPGRVHLEDYVLIAKDQAIADRAAEDAGQVPLSDDSDFSRDMGDLGEQGYASSWIDLEATVEAAGKALSPSQRAAVPGATLAMALRFDGQYAEVKGVVRGDRQPAAAEPRAGEMLARLPESTAAAVSLSGGDQLVDAAWNRIRAAGNASGLDPAGLAEQFGERLGLDLPEDLRVLLGRHALVSLDRSDGDGPTPVAALFRTDPSKAEPVADKLVAALRGRTGGAEPGKAKDAETLVVATGQPYADKVLAGGRLGESEMFRTVVPEPDGVVMAAYVDFEALGATARRLTGSRDYLALRAAGLTVRTRGDGGSDLTLRVAAR